MVAQRSGLGISFPITSFCDQFSVVAAGGEVLRLYRFEQRCLERKSSVLRDKYNEILAQQLYWRLSTYVYVIPIGMVSCLSVNFVSEQIGFKI